MKFYELIFRISFYGEGGYCLKTIYDSLASTEKFSSRDEEQIKIWISKGLYDEIDYPLSEYAKKYGCVIESFEAKEVSLFEGKL